LCRRVLKQQGKPPLGAARRITNRHQWHRRCTAETPEVILEMTIAVIYPDTIARKGIMQIVAGATTVMVLMFNLSVNFIPAGASTDVAAPLCGNGSAPDYGFTYDRQQAHWTVNWQDYVSQETVTDVDAVLDRLNDDSIAQTMIVIMPEQQVGNRVNCAVHFLRYMKLGEPAGERKDNGFVFLVVVEPTRIDVHYGVGLGLPALTAPELTALNRATEEAFQSTSSMDQALLILVQGFDAVARNNYQPLPSPEPATGTRQTQPLPSQPLGIVSICGLLCLGVLLLLFLMWFLSQMSRSGIGFNPSGSGSRGIGNPFGGGRSRPPPTRGGSGSGRSGRGN